MKYPLIVKCELLTLLLMLMSAYGFAQTKQFPVILDTFSQRPQLKIYTKLNLWEKRVQYIGPVIDTITIKHIIDPYEVIKNHSVYPEDEDTLMSKYYSSCQHGKLDIQVNTKKYVPLEETDWAGTKEMVHYYKSYPIIITNLTDSMVIVGGGYSIPIAMEALDKNGNWKLIEKHYLHFCGTGQASIFLLPKECVCVLGPVYVGHGKTKLRYRMGKWISNEFSGKMPIPQ